MGRCMPLLVTFSGIVGVVHQPMSDVDRKFLLIAWQLPGNCLQIAWLSGDPWKQRNRPTIVGGKIVCWTMIIVTAIVVKFVTLPPPAPRIKGILF